MADALDQIAAAIPFRALLLVRHQDAGLEEQPVPAAHHDAIVERKAQLGRARRIAHRRQRRQIGADRQNVLARQLREIRIGEGRVIARAVGRDAEAQRAVEIVVAPGAEPGLAIRRQVGRIDAAERRIDPLAAGERLCRDRRCGSSRSRRPPSAPCRGRCPRHRFGGCLKLELGMARGHSERSAQKQAGENRPHRPTSSLHPLASSGVIARKRGVGRRHAVSRRGFRTTQTEKRRRHSRHEIAIFESAAPLPRFVVRRSENPT